MASFALKLNLFVSSTLRMDAERALVLRVLMRRRMEAASDSLLLTTYSWDQCLQPGVGRPQSKVLEDLHRSDLVIMLFGDSIGSPSSPDSATTGMEEELDVARERARAGELDDVFVYVRQPVNCPRIASICASVQRDKSLVFMTYQNLDQLQTKVDKHTRRWLRRWSPVPAVCEWALQRTPPRLPDEAADHMLGENCLLKLERRFGPVSLGDQSLGMLGEYAIRAYQCAPAQSLQAEIPVELCASLETRYICEAEPAVVAQLRALLGLGADRAPCSVGKTARIVSPTRTGFTSAVRSA